MITWQFVPPLGFVLDDLQAIEGSLRSFKEPLQESVRSVLSPSIQQNFQVGGRPSWVPLQSTTIERVRRSRGTRPLVKSGNLAQVAASDGIWSIGDDEAFISNLGNAEYGVYHQTGFQGGRNSDVPAREWAIYQPEDELAVEEVFMKWIDDLFDKYGWG